MVNCAQISTDGFLQAYQAAEIAACQYVLVTPDQFESFTASPFALSLTDSLQIGGAAAGLWASAWCIRTVLNFMKGNDHDES